MMSAKVLADLCLSEDTSATIMFLAPRATRLWMTARPMGPAPNTKAESPSRTGEASTACHVTAMGSTSAAIRF